MGQKLRLGVLRFKMEKSVWCNGHAESVISVDVNKHGILASGGEDGLRIWTVDGAAQTFVKQTGEVTSISFCCQNDDRLYATVGQKLLMFDLRNLKLPICEFESSSDEINQVAVHHKGNFVGVCDDSGDVKIFDVQSRKLFKTLSRKHENICSSVQFRPSRPWEVVTGGMDFRIIYWDFLSGRSLQEVNMRELGAGEDLGAYFVNPPFVHSIHMSADGRRCAAGLGNGAIQLFHFEGKKKFVTDSQLTSHSQGVSQVHFPKFDPNGTQLVSGGNDSKVVLWSLMGGQGNECHGAAKHSPCSIIHEVNHGSKINCITSSSLTKKLVYVADQTNNISVYEVRH